MARTATIFVVGASLLFLSMITAATEDSMAVGLAEIDITPAPDKTTVYMAGFGHNRIARSVHDRLYARAIVFRHGKQKLAIVGVDLIGLFYPEVLKIRESLPEFTGMIVASTHNHEGPDTMGLWGPSPLQSGLNADYQNDLRKKIITAVRQADASAVPVRAKLGKLKAPELLHDTRRPLVKHDELVALELMKEGPDPRRVGILLQWNCHPETLDSKNTQISADFVGYTVKSLRESCKCPVVFVNGSVGGLMTTLHLEIKDEKGNSLEDGTYEKTERYGQLLANTTLKALADSQPIQLTPLIIRQRPLTLPVDNKLYQLAKQLGVLDRPVYRWEGDPSRREAIKKMEPGQALAIQTEIGHVRLGDLEIVTIPGEIYPELVLDQVVNPAEPEADFPDAPVEPAIYRQLKGPHRMVIGLANDEIGYIIPRRQWDEKPPYCYGLKKAPYGEVNSLGPLTAPLICEAVRDLVRPK